MPFRPRLTILIVASTRGPYWSSVTNGLPTKPWFVDFDKMNVGTGGGFRRLRAVRGGL